MRPTVIAVGGFNSNSGKTTLVCELLRALRGWEALKMTRGHYRSCGRDPHACCVAHLLGEEPVVRSGRAETYAPGKDTGRYWDAGASNVHWAVVTDAQVARGFELAMGRVRADGVFVEGNSFLRHADADFVLMVVRAGRELKIKPTARRVLEKVSAFYLFGAAGEEARAAREQFDAWQAGFQNGIASVPVYTSDELPLLVEQIESSRREKVAA
jgi:molybdopterin-guanine dinucleotide biosynthesis protein